MRVNLNFKTGSDEPKDKIHIFTFKLSKNGIYEYNFGDTLL